MAVEDPSNYLSDHDLCGVLIQMFEPSDVVQEVSSLEELHDDYDFHVLHGKAFVHLNNVLMSKRFEDLSFDKNCVDITNRANIFSFDDFYGEFFFSLFVFSQIYFSEASFSQ